jgi:predicted dehydrogenase
VRVKWAWDPDPARVAKWVPKGAFGRITRAAAWNCHGGSLGGWFDEKPGNAAETWRWMAEPKVAGVGAFGDLGTHSLDVLMWLLGEVETVSAEVRVVTGRYGDCDETGTAMPGLAPGPEQPLQQWVDAVAGAADQPLVTPREAADRAVAMEAAYTSAREGRWVRVVA